MRKRLHWIRLAVLAGLMLVGAQSAVWAACGTCQVCREKTRLTIPADYCSIADGENGSLCCAEESIGIATYCTESGTLCYGIGVSPGGGGSGGGGGGGGCAYQSGWCPPECMSCSGGTRY